MLGFYNIQISNNDNVNDAGSLERNVSSLNIAFDSPTTVIISNYHIKLPIY